MEEPKLIKIKTVKLHYLYNIIISLILLFGVSYAFVFFMYGKSSETNTIGTGLISVDITEDGNINLTNLVTQTDEEGLNNDSKVMYITNTSNGSIGLKLTLARDNNSTLNITNIRYGLYINDVLINISNVPETGLLHESLLVKDEKMKIEIFLWLDYSYIGSGEVFSGEFQLSAERKGMVGSQYLAALLNNEKGLYAINTNGSLSDGSNIREYRYSGVKADNYVWFNCSSSYTSGYLNASSNCELWRIVGVFEDEYGYQKIKLVKDTNISNSSFGSDNSYVNSSIMSYLNDAYYDNLSESSKQMIMSSILRLGSSSLSDSTSLIYSGEDKYIYSDYKVGLLSASDVGYSTNPSYYTSSLNDPNVYTNSWLKGNNFTTLTKLTDSSTTLVSVNDDIITTTVSTDIVGIKPTIYLKPNVSIVNGDGTLDKPYELQILDNGYYNKPTKNFMNNRFPSAILDSKDKIKEVYFINELTSITDIRYNAATIKANITDITGRVLCWLEDSEIENGKYNLYVASEGTTYLTSGDSLFKDFIKLSKIEFNNVNTTLVTNMDYMFANCFMLTDYNLNNFNDVNVTSKISMLNNVGRIVPLEYQMVNYLESRGTQYIDTDYFPNNLTKIVMKFNQTVNNNPLFSSNSGTSYTDFSGYGNQNGLFEFGKGTISSTINTNTDYVLEQSQNGLIINNTLMGTYNSQVFTSSTSLKIGYNTTGFIGKIYYVKLWDDNLLVRNMVPCYRLDDNKTGMYDVVNDIFYTNAGTDEFIMGNFYTN